jgi:RNA polymerase sigma factor (sigma-70 family)
MWLTRIVEDVVRNDGARVLAGLIRLADDFETAEDALQEAYARALVVWPRDGIPEKPAAWLNTVSRRIVLDRLRRGRTAPLPDDLELVAPEAENEDPSDIDDDRLRLVFTCCHPALSPEARCGLALRTLGGLSTREIARAFVEPEATTAQRLVRAKKKIREARKSRSVAPPRPQGRSRSVLSRRDRVSHEPRGTAIPRAAVGGVCLILRGGGTPPGQPAGTPAFRLRTHFDGAPASRRLARWRPATAAIRVKRA